jgi:hypothetical protein
MATATEQREATPQVRASWLARWWPWMAGTAVGLVVLGPALAPGPLLNLDLVLFDRVPVPRGTWGLGPEFPRRVPTFLPLAWLSGLVGGDVVGKALLVACVAVAFVGAHRMARGTPGLPRVGAALLYGASPWMLSRLGVGHLGMLVPAALLPWALPDLLRPSLRPRMAFLWMVALGLGGFVGGVLAGFAVLVGLVADRGRRLGPVVGCFLLAQLPWLVPGLVVALQGTAEPEAGDGFATVVHGPLGVFEVAAGHGFWLQGHQVGKHTPGVWLVGVVLVVLALLGRTRLPATWGGRATALAVVGIAASLASGLPLLDDAYAWLASTPVGIPLREGQRLLPLWLVWLAPAAAFGAARLHEGWEQRRPIAASAVLAVPLALGMVLAGPGLWGLGGILEPFDVPPEWVEARDVVDEEPGTVLALPWTRYMVAEVAENRRILHPVPLWFGGDVLASSNARVSVDGGREVADPREDAAELAVVRLRTGGRAADELAALGVRWVVLLKELSWRDHEGLARDPGLELVVSGPTLDLYRVRPWVAPVVDDDGAAVDLDVVAAPFATADGGGAAVWARPAEQGWLRGLEPAGRTSEGLVRLPEGSGPVWFWPSLLVLVADGLVVGAVAVVAWREVRGRRRGPRGALHP